MSCLGLSIFINLEGLDVLIDDMNISIQFLESIKLTDLFLYVVFLGRV
jgi:hypothetical protein